MKNFKAWLATGPLRMMSDLHHNSSHTEWKILSIDEAARIRPVYIRSNSFTAQGIRTLNLFNGPFQAKFSGEWIEQLVPVELRNARFGIGCIRLSFIFQFPFSSSNLFHYLVLYHKCLSYHRNLNRSGQIYTVSQSTEPPASLLEGFEPSIPSTLAILSKILQ